MTLKEIAKEAGVSISTVSRVVNRQEAHAASPEVQKRIWEIVGRTGYVPNRSAQVLKQGADVHKMDDSIKSIACLFARTPESINDPFFSKLARSVESAAFKLGYHVQYSLTEIDIRSPQTLHSILDKRVRGVVILGRCDKQMLKYLKQCFRYVSYTGLNPLDAKYDQVICDGEEAGAAAVQYLYDLGHRNIAYIGETKNEIRYTGYRTALLKNDLPFREEYVADVPLSTENGFRGTYELFQKARGVTAILCANDVTAIGTMRALREMNLRVPQDISVIGIDDIEMAQYLPTKLTSVHIPIEEMGALVTKILIDRINNGHQVHIKATMPFYIAEGESCAKPPKEAVQSMNAERTAVTP